MSRIDRNVDVNIDLVDLFMRRYLDGKWRVATGRRGYGLLYLI